MDQKPVLRIEQPEPSGKVRKSEVYTSYTSYEPKIETSNDVAEWSIVPTAVRDRLLTLRDAKSDRHAALRRIGEQREELLLELQKTEIRYEELTGDHGSYRLPDDHPTVGPVKETLARQKATFERLDTRYKEQAPVWQSAARLVSNLERYLRKTAEGGIGRVGLHNAAPPQLKAGETALAALDRTERQRRTLSQNRELVLAASFPTAYSKKLMREQIEKLIAGAEPDVSPLVDRGEPVEFPKNRTSISQYGGSAGSLYIVDPVGLMAWLLKNEILAALDKKIDAAGDDANALGVEERIAKLKEIDGDILACERKEAHFCELAGLLPRPDLDPRAVLGLASDMPAPKR